VTAVVFPVPDRPETIRPRRAPIWCRLRTDDAGADGDQADVMVDAGLVVGEPLLGSEPFPLQVRQQLRGVDGGVDESAPALHDGQGELCFVGKVECAHP
jgi:hypothetical protein